MGMTTANAQLNVRRSKVLKDKGEVELAEAWYSPSEFIRIVWNGAAKGARVIQQIVYDFFAAVQHAHKLLDNLASFPNMGRAADPTQWL